MDNWQSTFLGLKRLQREPTAFEIEALLTFTRGPAIAHCPPPLWMAAPPKSLQLNPAPGMGRSPIGRS